jgi:hypothetical protein
MVFTYKNRFNKKYGFEKDEPHSLAEIAKITGFKKSGLQTIFDKGVGAFKPILNQSGRVSEAPSSGPKRESMPPSTLLQKVTK